MKEYTAEDHEEYRRKVDEQAAKEEEALREKMEKESARRAWLADGGSEPDFAKAWPKLRDEGRRRRASKGGKRGGRGRPQVEVGDIKQRLSDLADDVLAGRQDKAVAAVASQVLNVYLRAISVEMKQKEQLELVQRLEALEEGLDQNRGGSSTWRV